MTLRPSARFLLLTTLCLALAACAEQSTESAEALSSKVHRLTASIAGDEPAESRLAKDAAAICPAGYNRQEDQSMPADAPRYRVWLVRCH